MYVNFETREAREKKEDAWKKRQWRRVFEASAVLKRKRKDVLFIAERGEYADKTVEGLSVDDISFDIPANLTRTGETVRVSFL